MTDKLITPPIHADVECSPLQVLAIVAAIVKKPLRETLDVNDFDGQLRLIAEALKDGKSKSARDAVANWLTRRGVVWDGKSDIGEAVLKSLSESNRLRRARTQLKIMEQRLRWPYIAGPQAVQESLDTLKAIEESLNGQRQQSFPDGKSDP